LGTDTTYKGGISSGKAKDPLPLLVRVGLGNRLLTTRSCQLLCSFDLIKFQDNNLKFHLGFECVYQKRFAIRIGYRSKYDTLSWSGGFGFMHNNFIIDYAVIPIDDLGLTHYLTLVFKL
jgi:hypothetical protein